MKFREYVGEDKVQKVKKIVNTNIGETDDKHLREVLREAPDGSKLEYYNLGFNLSKKNLKRVFDYIKSWFIRYNVPYKPINPCLELYDLSNIKSSKKILKKLRETKWGVIYKPQGTLTVISMDGFPLSPYGIIPKKGKDYIVLDYFENFTYSKVMEDIFNNMDINIEKKYCFVKLFEIESGIFTHKMYEDMMYSCPLIPKVKLNDVNLIRR